MNTYRATTEDPIALKDINILPNTQITDIALEGGLTAEHTRYAGLERPIYTLYSDRRIKLLTEELEGAQVEYKKRLSEKYEDVPLRNYIGSLAVLTDPSNSEILDRVTLGHAEISRYQDIRFGHIATGRKVQEYIASLVVQGLQEVRANPKEQDKIKERVSKEAIPLQKSLSTAKYFLELQAMAESIRDLGQNDEEVAMWYLYAEVFPPLQKFLFHGEAIFEQYNTTGELPLARANEKVTYEIDEHDWAMLSLLLESPNLPKTLIERNITSATDFKELLAKQYNRFLRETGEVMGTFSSHKYRTQIDLYLNNSINELKRKAKVIPNPYID